MPIGISSRNFATTTVFYDNAGHMHYSAGDREAANREIAKKKAENS